MAPNVPNGMDRPRTRTLNRTASWYHARLLRAAWLHIAVTAVVCACVACAETARGPLAGASDAWSNPPEPALSIVAAVPLTVWDAYAEAQHWPPANQAPFTSHGHQPEQQVDVRVNEVASPSYAALVTDTVFPEGSVLAQLSHTGGGHGYVMRKLSGTWSYFELDSRGGVLANGTLPLCAGCHAQAPADHVFGLPRAP